jgi:dihydroorotase
VSRTQDTLVLKGGRIIDATGERTGDVVVVDGRIAAVGDDLSADRTIDVAGCVVAPGLVDLHSHLREPGKEEAETVESGSRCAAAGSP